jgi:hypothetical protein
MATVTAQKPTDKTAYSSSSSTGDGDLGIDSSLLYESFTDAAAHCVAGAYLAVQAFFNVCNSSAA